MSMSTLSICPIEIRHSLQQRQKIKMAQADREVGTQWLKMKPWRFSATQVTDFNQAQSQKPVTSALTCRVICFTSASKDAMRKQLWVWLYNLQVVYQVLSHAVKSRGLSSHMTVMWHEMLGHVTNGREGKSRHSACRNTHGCGQYFGLCHHCSSGQWHNINSTKLATLTLKQTVLMFLWTFTPTKKTDSFFHRPADTEALVVNNMEMGSDIPRGGAGGGYTATRMILH